MSRHITIWQHHPAEGPGRIAHWAAHRGHRLTVSEAWGDGLNGDDVSDALIILGGPYSLLTPPPWIIEELQLLKQLIQKRVPVLGICLGSQLLASALGGTVVELGFQESGWTEITLGDGVRLNVLNWHEQGYVPPNNAMSGAYGQRWREQMFVASHGCVGMQFHPEWDSEAVNVLNHAFGDDSPLHGIDDAVRQAAVVSWFFPFLDRWMTTCDEHALII